MTGDTSLATGGAVEVAWSLGPRALEVTVLDRGSPIDSTARAWWTCALKRRFGACPWRNWLCGPRALVCGAGPIKRPDFSRAHLRQRQTPSREYLRDLVAALDGEPQRARDLLAKHVGQIVLTPKQEGEWRFYVATGGLDLSVALGSSPRATEESLIRKVAGTDLNL